MDFNQAFSAEKFEIEASPEKMRETASKMQKICIEMKEHIQAAHNKIISEKEIWDSPGYDLLKEIYTEESSEYETFDIKVIETIKNLERIIDLYQGAEDKSVQDSASLPDTVLQ